jgi:hypothetical protein
MRIRSIKTLLSAKAVENVRYSPGISHPIRGRTRAENISVGL